MALFGRKKKEEFKKVEPVMDPQDPSFQQAPQPVQEPFYPEAPTIQEAPVQQSPIREPAWVVKQVATQTEPVICNKQTNKPYSVLEILAEILNRTEE